MAFTSWLRGRRPAASDRANRLEARLATERPLTLVPEHPRPWLAELRLAVAAVDVTGVIQLYRDLDTAGRFCFLDDFEDLFDMSQDQGMPAAGAWTAAPELYTTPHGRILQGVIHRAEAWAARGFGLASETTLAGADAFATNMTAAIELLIDAGRELNDDDIVPYLVAQTCSYPLDAATRLEIAAFWQNIDPFNREGLFALGAVLDERWSNDPDAQMALAEWVAINAPEGHDALGVVPRLVAMRWEFLACFEELKFGECDVRTVEHPRIKNAVVLAYRKLIDRHELDSGTEARFLNYFAWCLYFGEVDELAHEAFARLQGRVYPAPWLLRVEDDETASTFEAFDRYKNTRNNLIEHIEFAE